MTAMATSRTDSALVPAPRLVRVFLHFFCFVLAGYAVFGKDFAYLGFPPLYIGEMALVLGAAVALIAGNLTSAILNLPGLALALLMIWTAHRTIPYWSQYGLDAPRDAMIVFYGLFAYVIASLVLQRPSTFLFLVERYKRFISYAIFLAPIVVALGAAFPPLLGIGPHAADLACHLTAIFALALIGFVRLRPLAFLLILLFELFAFTQAREAMIVFVVGCSLAIAFSPGDGALRRILACVGVCVTVGGILFVVDFRFDSEDLRRPVSARQYVENVTSIFTGGDNEDETREWRLNWWTDITNYTLHGPYFWTGKGFGPNLADTDGYQTSGPDEAPLRSPHNAHMTILARGGVPEFVLWISALGAWFGAMTRQLMEARRLRDDWWASVFAFLLIYWTAILVASSFSVMLEGPVVGIWFWTIHGVGLAGLILHRHRVASLQDRRLAAHVPFAG
ncbi:MAG: O-antigen ligase family protein [Proteobacteria bacterium]|nr:O-antigen ligase family protein [Pseudomonadota bacterium]